MKTIIISTHILPEVSMTCSKVVIINEGRIVAVDETENIGKRFAESHQIEMLVQGPQDKIIEKLSQINGIKKIDNNGNQYTIDVERDHDLRSRITRSIVENGFDLLELKTRSLTLEDVFLRLVTEEEGE